MILSCIRRGRIFAQLFGRAVLDLVYPRRCAVCGEEPDPLHHYLCWNCRCRIRLIQPPLCEICGRTETEGENCLCTHCRRQRPYFDRARAAAHYGALMRDLVPAFKYRQALWLRHDLGMLLRAGLAAHYRDTQLDAVTFVPLFHARQRSRTFNQAQLLAAELARRGPVNLPLVKTLKRGRNTPSQTHLTAADRIVNVKGVFKARFPRRISGRNLLLVDDVMTTGATVNECARVLKQAGAAGVYVLTLCHG